MSLVGIQFRRLITIGTTGRRLYLLELRQFSEPTEHIHQVRIVENRRTGEQFTEILNGRRDALDEVLLLLEVASEAVCPQHLQGTEEHEQRETVHEMTGRWYLDIILQRVIVLIDQFATEFMGIPRRRLPEERG